MDEAREIYTLKEGKTTLREYVVRATNKHCFEVTDGSRVVYEGESYQKAKLLYQALNEKKTETAEMPIEALSQKPKRRLVRLRTAYAQVS